MEQAKKAKQHTHGLKRNLNNLVDLAGSSKRRLEKALSLVRTGEYTGEKIAGDFIDQVRDVWSVLTNAWTGPDDDAAVIYLPADPNEGTGGWLSDVLSLDEPRDAEDVATFIRSDLLGPVVGNQQQSIRADEVSIVLEPVGAKTSDYYVKISKSPKEPGLYRGVILNNGLLITEVYAYAYRTPAPPPPPPAGSGGSKRSKPRKAKRSRR